MRLSSIEPGDPFLERRGLLLHVVVPILVARLDASQAIWLKLRRDVARYPESSKVGFRYSP